MLMKAINRQNYQPKQIFIVLLHISVWLGFVFILNLESLNLLWGQFGREGGSLFVPLLYGCGFGALIFYLNADKLIPRYLGKDKKGKFWLKATLLVLLVSVVETIVDFVYLAVQDVELIKAQLLEISATEILNTFLFLFVFALVANLFCWVMSFAYRIPKDWIKSEKQKRQLEQDKLRSELDFLKAQINPHFLFNGINSIYHMIGIDADAAKETLLQFSGLLRYQLYECNEEFISLPKELEYISNYLNIEEVRKGEDAMFTFDLPKDGPGSSPGNYKIAPLLITPFLENAFKYLSHHSERKRNIVFFKMDINEYGVLTMTVKNSHDPKMKTNYPGTGGIGLENVKRRLSILYPDGKHELKITQDNEMYHVELMIKLNEN
ncbi:MAG: hypothetical protein C0591_13345 [Marinilabiliales bacterium]|nr:MAG: hypothetical protein C0591_13345 [Marinilabiliales bacterium]